MLSIYSVFLIFTFAICYYELNAVPLQRIEVQATLNNTRRIMGGKDVGDTRPYMVYLRAASGQSGTKEPGADWLCGGAIIHERYVLTSAACIEDIQQFFVISGTHKWYPGSEKHNDCINNGAKKAVWKCVPKSYVFDGKEFENVLWMANDIAVVKVEDDFNFKRRVRGCDFVPQKIGFNNISEEMEKTGTTGSIAGWGSIEKFTTGESEAARSSINSPMLLEAEVVVLSKKNCKKRWDPRYHHIIDEHMICAKDGSDAHVMSEICQEQEVNCKELVYSDEENEDDTARRILEPTDLVLHESKHTFDETRRQATGGPVAIGGFCENDHGGPLVVGQGKSAVVVGIISACMTREITKKCYGPFLYTSVWKNRHLINCAIDKEIGLTCKMLLRAGKTHLIETMYNWNKPEIGPRRNNDKGPRENRTTYRFTKKGKCDCGDVKSCEKCPLSKKQNPNKAKDRGIYMKQDIDTKNYRAFSKRRNLNYSKDLNKAQRRTIFLHQDYNKAKDHAISVQKHLNNGQDSAVSIEEDQNTAKHRVVYRKLKRNNPNYLAVPRKSHLNFSKGHAIYTKEDSKKGKDHAFSIEKDMSVNMKENLNKTKVRRFFSIRKGLDKGKDSSVSIEQDTNNEKGRALLIQKDLSKRKTHRIYINEDLNKANDFTDSKKRNINYSKDHAIYIKDPNMGKNHAFSVQKDLNIGKNREVSIVQDFNKAKDHADFIKEDIKNAKDRMLSMQKDLNKLKDLAFSIQRGKDATFSIQKEFSKEKDKTVTIDKEMEQAKDNINIGKDHVLSIQKHLNKANDSAIPLNQDLNEENVRSVYIKDDLTKISDRTFSTPNDFNNGKDSAIEQVLNKAKYRSVYIKDILKDVNKEKDLAVSKEQNLNKVPMKHGFMKGKDSASSGLKLWSSFF